MKEIAELVAARGHAGVNASSRSGVQTAWRTKRPPRRTNEMTHKPFQRNLFGISALVLVGALAAGAGLAQPAPGGPGRFARGIRAAMATLDLSDSQKEKVKAIFVSHKDEGQAFRDQMRAHRSALR